MKNKNALTILLYVFAVLSFSLIHVMRQFKHTIRLLHITVQT